jgi:hypothetical protein
MRSWNLKPGDPYAFTLAADARLPGSDYCDDQIWKLASGSGEPPALALQTTYGLRARSMRLFPRFTRENEDLVDPAGFAKAPCVRQFFPNYLHFTYAPFTGIDVQVEVWVPVSQAIVGRFLFTNESSKPVSFQLDWVAQLNPTEGERMAPLEVQGASVLAGQTEGLRPVVFMTGGAAARSSPFPALRHEIEISPGASRSLIWCHTALPEAEASFDLARQLASRPFDADIARLELLNAGQVEIFTGDADWDAVLALSQCQAYGLFTGPGKGLPHPSFVLTRQPDQGFSPRGDGSDYNHLWNGQPALDAYHLSNLLLPGGASLLQGILRNFLAAQEADGSLDWKPGMAGQRSRLMAPPILATLALRIYRQNEDLAFLQETFPALLDFMRAWLTPAHDADGDGIPEWDHPMQAGIEEHPVFSRWQAWSLGVDIATTESPALCALLYREIHSLVAIARLLERAEPIPVLLSMAEHILTALESAWDDQAATYRYLDRDSHQSPRGEWLGERTGPGLIPVDITFEQPARLLVRIRSVEEVTIHPRLFVHGDSASGQHRIEQLSEEGFRWYFGQGTLTGERVYGRLERVEVQGIGSNDKVTLYTVDYQHQDITCLAPLWAEMPIRMRAEALVGKTILDEAHFWLPCGLPACLTSPDTPDSDVCRNISLLWNLLVCEGLLAYDFNQEAVVLVQRLMSTIIAAIKSNGAFRRSYSAESGEGSGERDILAGLAPVGLFLDTLGVRLVSPRKVQLSGFNPYPWPVTVKYRGLTVFRQKDKSVVIFPDGQAIDVTDPQPCTVSLD